MVEITTGVREEGVEDFSGQRVVLVDGEKKEIAQVCNLNNGDLQITFTDGSLLEFRYEDHETDSLFGEWSLC